MRASLIVESARFGVVAAFVAGAVDTKAITVHPPGEVPMPAAGSLVVRRKSAPRRTLALTPVSLRPKRRALARLDPVLRYRAWVAHAASVAGTAGRTEAPPLRPRRTLLRVRPGVGPGN